MPDEDEIEPQGTAFLLDFDGTLAEIVNDPAEASLTPRVAHALGRLNDLSGGALALISGRAVSALDRFLHPLVLPAAGVHGLEFRGPDGVLRRGGFDEAALSRLTDGVVEFAGRHPGLLAETKPGSVALHYRKRPDLEAECLAFAERLSRTTAGAALMRGKMVAEFRFGGRSKADAVSAFAELPPFKGRTLVFAGDDVTDEDAFRRVAELGGIGIKVGPGVTAARLRAPDIAGFHRWLALLSEGHSSAGLLEPAARAVASAPHERALSAASHELIEGTFR